MHQANFDDVDFDVALEKTFEAIYSDEFGSFTDHEEADFNVQGNDEAPA